MILNIIFRIQPDLFRSQVRATVRVAFPEYLMAVEAFVGFKYVTPGRDDFRSGKPGKYNRRFVQLGQFMLEGVLGQLRGNDDEQERGQGIGSQKTHESVCPPGFQFHGLQIEDNKTGQPDHGEGNKLNLPPTGKFHIAHQGRDNTRQNKGDGKLNLNQLKPVRVG